MRQMSLVVAIVILVAVGVEGTATAEARIERNVVYGMYSGLALLMDVYHPEESNGYGVLVIWGSGWHSTLAQNAWQLKENGAFSPLPDAGYTVFVINHRARPRFRYPAAVEDAQRAVRFIRHHAEDYGITADRIGGVGSSSGAHLVSMLGTLDGQGDPDDLDPVNRASAKLQAVVSFAGPSDLATMAIAPVVSFIGMPLYPGDTTSEAYRMYWEASPANHVSRDDAPFLLIHGDADDAAPFEQALVMERALSQAGVERRLVRVPDGPHAVFRVLNRDGSLATETGRFEEAEVVDWFDTHLRNH